MVYELYLQRLHTELITDVTKDEWPALQHVIATDIAACAEVTPEDVGSAFSLESSHFVSYEAMLLSGFQLYLQDSTDFENRTFPLKFPYGTGTYASSRPRPVMFGEAYRRNSRLSTHIPHLHSLWHVWCQLIEIGASVCAQAALTGEALAQERRHFPFIRQAWCAVCGPVVKAKKCSRCELISYCSKEHQTQDWKQRHKKHCKAGCRIIPGEPL